MHLARLLDLTLPFLRLPLLHLTLPILLLLLYRALLILLLLLDFTLSILLLLRDLTLSIHLLLFYLALPVLLLDFTRPILRLRFAARLLHRALARLRLRLVTPAQTML